jgi:hypothetical protein
MRFRYRLAAISTGVLALATPCVYAADNAAQQASDQQSLDELRNTLVNLLQTLVDKGYLTGDQAQQLVKQAQTKAAADASADAAKAAEQAASEQNAVRVPYVPQIIQDQIAKQVEQQVQPAVVSSVLQTAKDQKWGVPGALPDWLSRTHVFGDITLREQNDMFEKDNAVGEILDYSAINQAGSIEGAAYPFINTSDNRNRLRERARLGVESDLTPNWTVTIRLATGSPTIPYSESQNEGTYGERYSIGLDEAALRWDSNPPGQISWMTAEGGRLLNPWFAPTELVYAHDLTFEGVADTWRHAFGQGEGVDRPMIYLTVAADQMLEVPLDNPDNKWFVGAQLGTNLPFAGGAQHLRLGAAYYDFLHVTGIRNSADSIYDNFTAPAVIQYGNTYFDIANSSVLPPGEDDLFALAARFRLVDVAAEYQLAVGSHQFTLDAEGVRNIGYNRASVEILSGQTIPKAENTGYVGEIGYGDPEVNNLWDWRARLGYRYVRRDAVLDAWTDADFHGGGTNAQGYYFWTEVGLASNVWARVRYMSGNEVDGPRFGLDILQVDLNARF